ncbi:hypothetical protein TrRE_jg9626 [Triparma retinervis]|uniref:Uncharacterized protein n=1 Tax=Triparma retinervis TaxID=2557542 RepID=A0A9W6ZL92_9STRA|nr:hypothetical protein TrRE_jg9626 [Triparma retinervis]
MSSLDLQWDNAEEGKLGHYQKCNPSQCEYIEEESINDIALKVLALASPIFSTVMSGFIVIYGCLDNHWSEREHDMIDNLGNSKRGINNPIGGIEDNSL